jgi:hypothetical protein
MIIQLSPEHHDKPDRQVTTSQCLVAIPPFLENENFVSRTVLNAGVRDFFEENPALDRLVAACCKPDQHHPRSATP